MARIDRAKRSLGTAVRRTGPSRPAELLVARGLAKGRVLDYGCGYGVDADTFGWEAYDPFYRPQPPTGPYDTVVCILVLNTLSRTNRAKLLARLQSLLAPDGRAYLAVARNVPVAGKLGIHHCLQHYVVLTLPVVFEDADLAIYVLQRDSVFEDRTKDFRSRRDARRDA